MSAHEYRCGRYLHQPQTDFAVISIYLCPVNVFIKVRRVFSEMKNPRTNEVENIKVNSPQVTEFLGVPRTKEMAAPPGQFIVLGAF